MILRIHELGVYLSFSKCLCMVLIVGHDDGEEGLIVGLDDRDVSTIDLRFVVVGRVVSDRPVSFPGCDC